MSWGLDLIRSAIGGTVPEILGDTYTVTVDPQGTNTTYTGKGTPDTDVQRHRDNGLTVEDTDQVVILYQTEFPSNMPDPGPSDYLTGPTDAANRSSESLVITDSMRDPANATWIVSAGK